MRLTIIYRKLVKYQENRGSFVGVECSSFQGDRDKGSLGDLPPLLSRNIDLNLSFDLLWDFSFLKAFFLSISSRDDSMSSNKLVGRYFVCFFCLRRGKFILCLIFCSYIYFYRA